MSTDTAMMETQPPSADAAAVERDVSQVRDQWIAAAERDDAAVVAALYTEDAEFVAPDLAMPVTGRQAIQDHFARNLPMASNLQIQSTDFEVSGDLAYDFGEYNQRITPPKGEPVEERGRYLVVLRRDDAGGWKIEKHIGFPLSPPPATTTAARR